MRIGIVTGEYPPLQGGIGAYTRIIAKNLTAQGHQVFIFSNTKAHEVDPAIQLTNPVKKWRLSSLYAVKRWVKSNSLDIVNLQYETMCYNMSPWIHFMPCYLRGLPFITTFHDLSFPYLFPKAGWLRHWIVMLLARASTGVIATNYEDMAYLRHLTHTIMIPIGSNILTRLPDDFNRIVWREKMGVSKVHFLLAHYGFINRSKNIEMLLEALTILINENFPVKLVMIGGRTGSSDPTNVDYLDKIEALITKLGLEGDISWTGFIDNNAVAAYLKASDAVVLPFRNGASYRRGSLLTSIQYHCPIITTYPKVKISVFKHGENMLFFPPNDITSLCGAIKRLYTDSKLCTKLSNGARELSKNFDWNDIVQNYIFFFRKIIRKKQMDISKIK